MKINKLFLGVAIATMLTTSCVSTQKYKDMQTARDHFKAEYENLRVSSKENEELKNQLRMSESQLMKAKFNLEQKQTEIGIMKNYNEELSVRYEKAAKENSALLSEYSLDKMAYEEAVSKSLDELRRKQNQLDGLEGAIGDQNTNLENMKVDLMTREQRVAELERLVAEKQAQMDNLRTSLNSALRGFNASDLSAEERNGRIYVSMSQNLLFKAGSDKVDPKGVDALAKLAKALNDNPNIEIIVEGHTDNAGGVDYNWDLSVSRATSVVKILALYGVLPHRMVASGRGMHHPVVPNDNAENKAKNRRTEIILAPNLDKILELTK
ncbi:MAG: OmpA family protein [Saprospiraceae bacterium]|nr:OmpA family protein [Saprospiraceae bacterium]MCF8251775.1 OmpA family protein [Saprospiraceae bacterium]MCF8281261.1 OmpA family protein [Bacteroidales bacterium]MCF8313417.1 OmpA family protein [Saprospiraceae bacterium]MCF8442130.1 OmpA family protein [Saprospiraceae bacterium]